MLTRLARLALIPALVVVSAVVGGAAAVAARPAAPARWQTSYSYAHSPRFVAVQLADSQHSHIVLVAQVTITNDAAHARTLHRLTAWIAHSDGSGWAGVGGGWPAGCSASSYTVDGLRSWGPGEQVLNRRVPAHGSISLPVALATSRACAHVEPPLYVVAS